MEKPHKKAATFIFNKSPDLEKYVEKFAKYLLTYLPDEVLRKGYEVARHRQESPAVFDEKHKFKLIPPDTVNFS